MELKAGSWYRAKSPRRTLGLDGIGVVLNDRRILWISPDGTQIQYDGPAIPDGHHYPIVSREKFLEWAGREIERPIDA